MIFVTAADGKERYAGMAKHWIKQMETLKQRFEIYDLGGLGYGRVAGLAAPSIYAARRRKPSIIADAIERHPKETVIWLDVDAILVKPIPEIEDISYDIGVTYRGDEYLVS